ncbi:Uma2 family endonuclease [Thermocoleostomius sinensis]|uniref:Uma2 family endonuclease n=1 Tax=Thermocoleostomius sinensis A174 TaxID=2016057 RepID=A0A9E8ZAH4_9CYAN|nr:Uma2 family endonuclease [Thermocoleostomius sinensis]WAL59574.1 Uma2 family endonuclease [Thermocoleostomius sinensis A174]
MAAIILDLKPFVDLSDDQFYQLCQNHRDLKFERTSQGELVIVTPVGGEGGSREADLIGDLVYWNRRTQLGKVFSSSTCFKLPNGANRSPDVAWVMQERWNQLTPEQQKKFPPLCPDFVIELRSESDALELLQQKMQEYINNGLRLGWLINPQDRQVEIYKTNQMRQVLDNPQQLNGNDVLPGFMFDLSLIWD